MTQGDTRRGPLGDVRRIASGWQAWHAACERRLVCALGFGRAV